MINFVEKSVKTPERPLPVTPSKLEQLASHRLNLDEIMSLSCNNCVVDIGTESHSDDVTTIIASTELSVEPYTPTTTASVDECSTPTEETLPSEQYYTYHTRLHEDSSRPLTTLKVRLNEDEHDEDSDRHFYHRHSHHHHLPLTPPIVLLPSPCTPLTEATVSPTSSPPASPLAASEANATVTPTSLDADNSSVNVATELSHSNCVQKSSSEVGSNTDAGSPRPNQTDSPTLSPTGEPLGEFKRAGSTRRSQRFNPYGSSRRNRRPKAEHRSTVDDKTDRDVQTNNKTASANNAHLCDIDPSPLSVDTHLANVQSAVARREARDTAQQIAQQILSVIRENRFERLTELLNKFKPDLNVFVNGQTALHHCLLMGRDVSWCKELVMAGANPNLSNKDGWHPLHLAAFKGATETLNYLVSCNNNHHHTSSTTTVSSSSSRASSSMSVSSNRSAPTSKHNSRNVIQSTSNMPSSSSSSATSSTTTPTVARG